MNRRAFLLGSAVAVGGGFAPWQLTASRGAAGPVTTDAIGDQVQTVPKGQLPQFAETDDLRRLYRYAAQHSDELQYMPCFCGCYGFGHTSNRDCYIKRANADGTLTFTSHAAT